MRKKIGIFGGTFDPIHFGHLRLAMELKDHLHFDQLRLLPCHQPPHRGRPAASSQERVEMLHLALADCVELALDERELQRDGPSYTVETLRSYRAEMGEQVSLAFCMGADAFAQVNRWHEWKELLNLAHIVVLARPGWQLPELGALGDEVAQFFNDFQCELKFLDMAPSGGIYLAPLRKLAISATEIRNLIQAHQSAQFLLPDSVWNYVCEKKLYL